MPSATGVDAEPMDSSSVTRPAVIATCCFMAAGGPFAFAGPGCPCHQHQPLGIPASCLDQDGLSPASLRLRLAHDPDDAASRQMLLDLAADEDRQLPKQSAAYRAVREILPPCFTELQTRRFIILSDASPQWTRAQAERLERAHHQFHRFAARLELDPLPLEHKLVCVLFERREDYRAFAAEHDDVRDEWIAGYYSPRHDRIVFYNVESDPQMEDARIRLEGMSRDIEELSTRAELARRTGNAQEAQRLRQSAVQHEQHIRQERQRVHAFAQRVSIATTIHEAIHQLAFHTRVQSPYVQNPLWLSEGLATAFETDSPHQAFGPEHEYEPRRAAFQEVLERDELLPLVDLIARTNLAGANDVTARTFYAQSYALVTWMSRFRRGELRVCFDLLRQQKPGEIGREQQIELFEQAFGEIDRLERAWLRYERSQ